MKNIVLRDMFCNMMNLLGHIHLLYILYKLKIPEQNMFQLGIGYMKKNQDLKMIQLRMSYNNSSLDNLNTFLQDILCKNLNLVLNMFLVGINYIEKKNLLNIVLLGKLNKKLPQYLNMFQLSK